jgi:quercetin dioxygenase-like cupin family protein
MDKMRAKCSSTLLIEDQKVRVTRFEFEPDQETGWHEHGFDYVVNAITDCKMTLENSDGTKSTTEIKAGNAYSRKAGVCHNVTNSSEKQMTFIEIELKN